jgi:hypothetical protein
LLCRHDCRRLQRSTRRPDRYRPCLDRDFASADHHLRHRHHQHGDVARGDANDNSTAANDNSTAANDNGTAANDRGAAS